MSKNKKLWFGLSISTILLTLFFLTIDSTLMFKSIANANYLFIVPAIGLYLISLLFRTFRWQILLRHIKKIDVGRLYPVVIVGYMANNLLPFRLGELVRSYYLGEREDISKTAALVTIFIERLLDALTLLLFIAVAAMFIPLIGLAESFGEKFKIPWLILVISLSMPFVVAFIALLLMSFYPSKAKSMSLTITNLIPASKHFDQILDSFLSGLTTLRNPKIILSLFLISAPIWLLEAGLFFLIGLSFNLDEVYGTPMKMALAILIVTSISNIGSSVPAAPGGIGLFELVARETMAFLPFTSIDREIASGYVIVVHATLLLPTMLLGQVFLWGENISLLNLSKRAQFIVRNVRKDELAEKPEMSASPKNAPGNETK